MTKDLVHEVEEALRLSGSRTGVVGGVVGGAAPRLFEAERNTRHMSSHV